MNNRQVPEPEPEPGPIPTNPQDYAMEIFQDQKRRHRVHHTSANFTLRLTVKPVREPEPEPDSEEDTVVDNFMFRVDLTGHTGEAGHDKEHGRHANKDGRKVPTPHLQLNKYRITADSEKAGHGWVKALQDATAMTVDSLERIWGWPPIDLQPGQVINLQAKPRGGSLLQGLVDKETRDNKGLGKKTLGKVISVTFLGWGQASKQ